MFNYWSTLSLFPDFKLPGSLNEGNVQHLNVGGWYIVGEWDALTRVGAVT
jgi:hypothetical protein